jgi:hypothetical protein
LQVTVVEAEPRRSDAVPVHDEQREVRPRVLALDDLWSLASTIPLNP